MSSLLDGFASPLSRRQLLKRSLATGLTASAAGALLTACGSGASSGNQTLSIWDYYADQHAGYTAMLANFQAANPKIKINRTQIPQANLDQKITQGAAARQLPDLMVVDNPDHSSFASQGILTDITSNITSWGQADQYFPGPLHSAMWKGKYYGLPNVSNCLCLYYNVDMFNAAGLKPPATWDDLRTAAQTLTKNNVYGYSMSLIKTEEGMFQFLPFLWQSGADLDTLDSPDAASAVQLLLDFLKNGYMIKDVLNYSQQDSITQFINGKAAMSMNGPWQISTLQKSAQFKWAVAPLPMGKQAASCLGGENWAVAATSQSLSAAWTFLTWLQTPSNLKTYLVAEGALPARKDVAQDPTWQQDPNLSVFAQELAVARPRAYGPNYPQISAAVQEAFQSALTGQTSVAAAMATAANTVKPLLS